MIQERIIVGLIWLVFAWGFLSPLLIFDSRRGFMRRLLTGFAYAALTVVALVMAWVFWQSLIFIFGG